jgi:hypothetical protein
LPVLRNGPINMYAYPRVVVLQDRDGVDFLSPRPREPEPCKMTLLQ